MGFDRNWFYRTARAFVVTALLALTAGSFVSPAFALDENHLHQQKVSDDKYENQTHAMPKPDALQDQSFFDRYAPPKDITTLGHRIDWLFRYTSWTAFVFFVIMAGSLIYFIVFNRDRPGHKAYYTHGTSKANGAVTRLLDIAVFVSLDIVLIVASFRDTRDIVWAYPPDDAADVVKVQIMPQQWAWNFKYAGNDGKFGTADDVNTINDMRLPVGRKVLVQVKSRDVIHGFMIPYLRIQIDAIPGVVTKFWFDTNRVGDYELACYHHCGTSHYKMKAFVTVMEEADFAAWSNEQSEWALAMFDPDDKHTQWGWNWSIVGQPNVIKKPEQASAEKTEHQAL